MARLIDDLLPIAVELSAISPDRRSTSLPIIRQVADGWNRWLMGDN
jgi:hypothetical protein